jgi:hypothetical protein
MPKAIGRAGDFYRLRVMAMDTTDEVDLEWRDDILYRRPDTTLPEDAEAHSVEAVLIDDEEVVVRIATFENRDDAYAWLTEREIDLNAMTRSEFEGAYFPESPF